jgi:hypothetical protein
MHSLYGIVWNFQVDARHYQRQGREFYVGSFDVVQFNLRENEGISCVPVPVPVRRKTTVDCLTSSAHEKYLAVLDLYS